MAGAAWGLKLVALVVGLLVMVPETMQLSVDHPLFGVVQRLNAKEGPFLGIVLPNSASDEKLLYESGYFVTDRSLTIAGRKFNIGKFRGMSAIYVLGGKPLANVGVTVQLLLDTFKIMGLISYGKSGSTSDKLDIPNVVVPTHVAYTSVWSWQEYKQSLKEDATELPSLKFGDYNVPEAGENELGSVQFQEVMKYTPKSSNKKTFWYYVDPNWLSIANEIEGSELEKCINGTTCSDSLPVIIHGLRSASSDVLVSNLAYANFLHDELDVAAIDTASAAIVSTAVANGVPHIVFRAASNKPGVAYDPKLSVLAGENVLKVVAAFVDRLSLKIQPHISIY